MSQVDMTMLVPLGWCAGRAPMVQLPCDAPACSLAQYLGVHVEPNVNDLTATIGESESFTMATAGPCAWVSRRPRAG